MRLYKEKRFALEMGFSRKEFIALLDSQGKLIYEREGNLITFMLFDQQATITLGEEGARRIASARLPRLDVRFDFSNMNDDVQAQFMKTFLLKFHRGGG